MTQETHDNYCKGGFAYVANSGSSSVSTIDTDTNAVIKIISVGNGHVGVSIIPVFWRD